MSNSNLAKKHSDFEMKRFIYETVHFTYGVNDILKNDFLKIIELISEGNFLNSLKKCVNKKWGKKRKLIKKNTKKKGKD